MVYLAVLLLLGVSCSPYTKSDLAGKWQAVSLMEDGDTLAVDLAVINFQFTEAGYYHFNSTLNYEESGTYRLNGPYLYSTDTLDAPYREKAVKIVLLRNDSLLLKMEEMGKERMVLLKRE